MKAKELVELRRVVRNLVSTPDGAALHMILDRLDAIEDLLGLSYVVPPHKHRMDGTRTIGADGRLRSRCVEKGCIAYYDEQRRDWAEPEEQ